MQNYAVFGNPIKQSKSPIIHQAFAAQFGLPISYQAILSTEHDFCRDLQMFHANATSRGCNITAPFKLQAHQAVTSLSDDAKIAGAVNTIAKLGDGSLAGYNTDGIGLVNDIQQQGFGLKGSRILMLGAGGAARGVLRSLLACQPSRLVLANRTVAKAQELVDIGNSLRNTTDISASSFELASDQEFDVIINATSLSLADKCPDIPEQVFASSELVYDMAYKNEPTTFLQWALQNGAANIADGLGMLVGQAAKSFQIWTGFEPKIQPVIDQLRADIAIG